MPEKGLATFPSDSMVFSHFSPGVIFYSFRIRITVQGTFRILLSSSSLNQIAFTIAMLDKLRQPNITISLSGYCMLTVPCKEKSFIEFSGYKLFLGRIYIVLSLQLMVKLLLKLTSLLNH